MRIVRESAGRVSAAVDESAVGTLTISLRASRALVYLMRVQYGCTQTKQGSTVSGGYSIGGAHGSSEELMGPGVPGLGHLAGAELGKKGLLEG